MQKHRLFGKFWSLECKRIEQADPQTSFCLALLVFHAGFKWKQNSDKLNFLETGTASETDEWQWGITSKYLDSSRTLNCQSTKALFMWYGAPALVRTTD